MQVVGEGLVELVLVEVGCEVRRVVLVGGLGVVLGLDPSEGTLDPLALCLEKLTGPLGIHQAHRNASERPVVDSSSTRGGGMEQVSDILKGKTGSLLTIASDASVFDMVRQMVDANVGSLLVTVDGHIEGIVTERDYLRRVTLEGRTDKDTPVSEIMTTPLIVVTPETPVEECMAIMTDRRIRHMPVVENGEVVALVSIGDLVKFQSQQQDFKIQYLTDYITAR